MKSYIKNRLKEKTTKVGFVFVVVSFVAPYLTGMQINAITYLGMALVAVPDDMLSKLKSIKE